MAAQSCPVSLSTEASSSQATLHTEFTLVAAEQKKQPLRCFDTCTKTHSRDVRALFLSSLFLSPMLYDGDFECGEQSPPQPATPIKTPGRQRRARRKGRRGEAGADRPTGARAAARRTSDSPSPLPLFSPSSPQPLWRKYARARYGHLSARNLGFSAVLFSRRLVVVIFLLFLLLLVVVLITSLLSAPLINHS